jgi:hypothetical protein
MIGSTRRHRIRGTNHLGSRAMALAVATTIGLVIWIVLWALGTKALDAFLITVAIMLVTATARIVLRYLPGNRST